MSLSLDVANASDLIFFFDLILIIKSALICVWDLLHSVSSTWLKLIQNWTKSNVYPDQDLIAYLVDIWIWVHIQNSDQYGFESELMIITEI